MANKSVRYTPEFKRQMVDLVRSGRTPASLAKEFGPTPWWVKQDARDEGKGDGGLTSAEREELLKLRRENRRLKADCEQCVQLNAGTRSYSRLVGCAGRQQQTQRSARSVRET